MWICRSVLKMLDMTTKRTVRPCTCGRCRSQGHEVNRLCEQGGDLYLDKMLAAAKHGQVVKGRHARDTPVRRLLTHTCLTPCTP